MIEISINFKLLVWGTVFWNIGILIWLFLKYKRNYFFNISLIKEFEGKKFRSFIIRILFCILVCLLIICLIFGIIFIIKSGIFSVLQFK